MNTVIFQYLHNFAGQSVFTDTVIVFGAKYLPYIIVVSLALFIIFGRDRKQGLKIILCALASAVFARLIITELIRYFYHSPRPFMVYDFTPLIYDFNNSFPSGHAAFFFALATAIFLFHKKWGVAYFLGAIIIILSRIIAGIHWPTDVLGGIIVGIGSAILISFFSKKNLSWLKRDY